jgi:serine/threonine protein kinase
MGKYCPKCFKKYPPETERCLEDGSYLVSPMDKDLTGEVLDDRYTVMERIGRGGMGVVYRAEQHLIKRIVALKVLRRDVVQDESAVKRFLNEARAIASLDSRHTVTLHDFGVTRDGLLYYTMELLKGQPLSRIIRDESPVDHVRAAGLLLQACRSLGEAHEHNILHRDIKPDNLFVTVRNGREELKVLDFGIAKLVGDTSMDTVTRAGMIVGTPQYLSPEQALGNTVIPASDLYSLAIVFYEMLAGKPPFIGDTPMKTMWAHIRDPVPPLRKRNPEVQVPRSIEVFLNRALEKEPGKRFASTAAFADALRKAVEDHDASPETVSLPPLSTTDQGLRVRTLVSDGKKARGQSLLAPADESALHVDMNAGAPGPEVVSAAAAADPRPLPPDTFSGPIVSSSRRYALWLAGAAAALVLVVGLSVWAPRREATVAEPSLGGTAQADAATLGGVTDIDVVAHQDISPEVSDPDAAVGLDEIGAAVEPNPDVHLRRTVELADVSTPLRDIFVAPPEDVRGEPPQDTSGGSADIVTSPMEVAAAPCVPSCQGKHCGDDGCGGTCGKCNSGERCERGRCRSACVRDCRNKECGSDGCGAACGRCAAGTTCQRGRCESDKAETAARLLSSARSEMRMERYERALDKLNEAAAANGENVEIKNLRSDCYLGIRTREVKGLLAKARAALNRKDFDSCLDAAANAGRLDPGNGEATKVLKECKEKKDLEGMKF